MKKIWSALISILIIIECLVVGSDIFYRSIYNRNIASKIFLTTGWMILFGILLVIFISVSVIINDRFRSITGELISSLLDNPRWLLGIVVVLLFVVYEAFQDYLFLQATMPAVHYQKYRQFLSNYFSILPLVFLGGIQFLIVVITIRSDDISKSFRQIFDKHLLFIFSLFLVLLINIQFSGYGMKSNSTESGIYNTVNAPLPGIQVVLILLFMLFVAWVVAKLSGKYPIINRLIHIEPVVLLLIWLTTFIFWTQTPLDPNYYIDGPRYPNQELYPSSDPIYFDTQAHRVLVGEGFEKDLFAQHPMYSLVLSIFHQIAGDGYLDIIPLQLALLSVTPVLLFKLTSLIHNRLSGFIVSILFILRERNALLLGEYITVSNAKVLMTEPLFVLCIILMVYLTLLWMKDSGKNFVFVLLLGGVIGFAMLIRIEAQLFLPVIFIGTFLYFRDNLVTWLKGITLMIAAIAVMIIPWMVRNQQVFGSFVVDKPRIYQQTIQDIIESSNPDYRDPNYIGSYIIPCEDCDDLNAESGQTKLASISSQLPDFLWQKTAEGYISEDSINHFINNLVQTVYFLPSNHQPLLTIGSLPDYFSGRQIKNDLEGDQFGERYLFRYIKSVPYWSYDWDGKLVPQSLIPVMLTLIVISIGITRMKGLSTWITVFLFSMIVLYSLAFGFLGYSGGRYISAIEWIILLYYGIGISILLSGSFNRMTSYITDLPDLMVHQHHSERVDEGKFAPEWLFYPAWILIIALGISLYGADRWSTPQYSQSDIDYIVSSEVFKSSEGERVVTALLSEKYHPVIVAGKALYPKFFNSGESMLDDRKGTIPDSSIQRLEFYMVGVENGWVVLPGSEENQYLPHSSNVLVIGTNVPGKNGPFQEPISGDYIMAEYILIYSDDVDSGDWSVLNCSGQHCVLDPDIFP